MNDLIARTFVVLILLAYTAIFLAMVIAVVRKWLHERRKQRHRGNTHGSPDFLHLHQRDSQLPR